MLSKTHLERSSPSVLPQNGTIHFDPQPFGPQQMVISCCFPSPQNCHPQKSTFGTWLALWFPRSSKLAPCRSPAGALRMRGRSKCPLRADLFGGSKMGPTKQMGSKMGSKMGPTKFQVCKWVRKWVQQSFEYAHRAGKGPPSSNITSWLPPAELDHPRCSKDNSRHPNRNLAKLLGSESASEVSRPLLSVPGVHINSKILKTYSAIPRK